MELSIAAISLWLLLAHGANANTFDIRNYGAQAGGRTDISQALLSAWKDACACASPSKVVIPWGTYLLTKVQINGPCMAPVRIHLDGTLLAPADPAQFRGTDSWITIQSVDGLTITGAGTFDGRGSTAWTTNDCGRNRQCAPPPVNLRMNFLSNTLINGVTSKDAKFFHVTTLGCNNLTFLNFHVSAPKTSINTDGIHIGRSTRVNITDTIIATGDDCISIGDGSQQVYIKRVTCENTHGISVGSLGRYSFEQPVSGIYVKNCTISNAMTGLRVKTWPASPVAMSASEIHYQDIILNNVGTPILIDQEYCPNNQCSMQTPSLVQLSHVSFDNIQGTSSTHLAVKLVCSGSHPCQDVRVGNIHLTYTGPEGPATSLCSNVKPIFSGVQIPALCVSSAQAS